MNVPFLDLKAQHAPLRDEILGLWAEILDSAWFVGGPHVAGFEEDFAKACGAEHAVTVSNGTQALYCGLKALDLGPGDEVIVPANTFIATAEGVSLCGATPVFVDVLKGTYNIDPDAAAAAITDKTVGILGVHLYGQPCDADALQALADKHGLWFMEDSAQGHLATYKGRTAGSLGYAAGFSFYPGKNLGATGEGGAVTTDDGDFAAKVRLFRDHGMPKKYHHTIVGTNARLPALLAAALRVKLRHLPDWTNARRAHAKAYLERLAGVEGIELPVEAEWADSAWHLFVVHVADREGVQAKLKELGVAAGLHYPIACHRQPCYEHLGYAEGSMPVSEYNAANCLSLPMFPELTEAQIDHVAASLKTAVQG